MYYIYIIRCRPDVLYTGITTDVRRRMSEHAGRTENGAKFTHSHEVLSLEALWSAPDRSTASKLESALKKLPRSRKTSLIGEKTLAEVFGEDFAGSYSRLPLEEYADVLETKPEKN